MIGVPTIPIQFNGGALDSYIRGAIKTLKSHHKCVKDGETSPVLKMEWKW